MNWFHRASVFHPTGKAGAGSVVGWTESEELRGRVHVFRDRADAGKSLARLLRDFHDSGALVLAIPSGGVPVAAAIAEELDLPLDVAIVSKVTPSWNTEVGYGAVAFDGTVRIDEGRSRNLEITGAERQEDVARAVHKVGRRAMLFRHGRPFPDLSKHAVILVDDGLASGLTMEVAVEVLRKRGAKTIFVAVPTGHLQAVEKLAGITEGVYCANVRGGPQFAVAEAYEHWSDVAEVEAAEILSKTQALVPAKQRRKIA